jgi:hypothetical protein
VQLHHIVAPHAVTASLFINDNERLTSSVVFATGVIFASPNYKYSLILVMAQHNLLLWGRHSHPSN